MKAEDEESANKKAIDMYGKDWSMLYNEKDWKPDYFPAGELGVIG